MIFYFLLISILPLTRHPFWTVFVGELTMIKYVGGVCLALAALHVASRRSVPPFFGTAQSWTFLVLLGIVTLSYLTRGLPFSWETSPLLSYVCFFAFFVITLSLVDSLATLRWSLLVAIGSVAWATLYVIREFQQYGGRPGWVVGDPNYYTASTLLVIPLAYLFFRSSRLAWQRWFCFGCLLIILLGITLAASRGGLIGLVVALGFLAARSERRWRHLVLFGSLVVPLFVVAPDSPARRLLAPNPHDDQSAFIREILWAAGWLMIQQAPLTGIGLGNFKFHAPLYQQLDRPFANVAHNTYIELAAETGVPGLVAFIATLGLTLRSLEMVRRAARRMRSDLLFVAASGIQAGLVGFAANAVFISAEYQKLFWLMIFLGMCLPRLLRAAERAVRTEPRAAPGRAGAVFLSAGR